MFDMLFGFFAVIFEYSGLFAIPPILCLFLFLIFLIKYLIRRKRGDSPENLKTCKTLAKVFGVIALCFILLIAAAYALVGIAVANM